MTGNGSNCSAGRWTAPVYSVRIGAADQSDDPAKWAIAEDARKDPELNSAIYAFGDHYLSNQSSETARRSGKPLWANEDGPWAGDWARRHQARENLQPGLYRRQDDPHHHLVVDNRLLRHSSLARFGLMRAVEPWSGHYEIQPGIWAAAHTAQFAGAGLEQTSTSSAAVRSASAAMSPS